MKSRIKNDSWLITTPVAHRGLHNKEFGENSMGAFKNAIAKGYPIEMDLQLSKDGVLFCFHDDYLERVTGVKGYINDFTAEEIKKFKVCNTEEGIPTFEEFLNEVNGQVPLMIEIKQQRSKEYNIARLTVDALKGYKGEFVIQSFDPIIVYKVKKYAPEILRGQLGGINERGQLPLWKYWALRYLILNFLTKPDYINYYLYCERKKGKIPMVVWTVRTEKDLQAAKDRGTNFVFESIDI